MGNSRVIFVGAVSIIMGLYSVGLQKAERAVGRIGEVHAFQIQAEEIAKSGISLAINKMGQSKPAALPKIPKTSMFEGFVVCVVDDAGLPSDQARITSIGHYDPPNRANCVIPKDDRCHTATRVAIVRLTGVLLTGKGKKRWSNWEVVKVYTKFRESEFVNQYTTEDRSTLR